MTPLLAQFRRGERAFERLYRRHVGDVYRYALILLRDPQDAEEVTLTTFLNAYRMRGRRPRNTHAWLLGLAHGLCRQRFRAEGLNDDEAAPMIPDEDGPSAAQIRRALAHLPLDQRAALVMRGLEGRPYPEIAEVLDLPLGAVEEIVFRAHRALREQLEGTLTCHEAERTISRQVDGRLPRSERGPLRTHLRECRECADYSRSHLAQRSAWTTLASVPLPASLQSFFGPGGVTANAAMTAAITAGSPAATTLAVVAVALSTAAPAARAAEEA